jgi:RND family efflux transporter MFP subunit
MLAVVVFGFFTWLTSRRLFTGISSGEVTNMLKFRHKRLLIWLLILGGTAYAACTIQMERTASGPFTVRPLVRAEIHAPVAGFLRELPYEEGERVSPGGLIARIDVPDLATKLGAKRTEITEATARLAKARMELNAAQEHKDRGERLFKSTAMPEADYRDIVYKLKLAVAEVDQTTACLERAKEEAVYLESVTRKLPVGSPVPGIITTPHLKEKLGQFVKEGDLICVVEEPTDLVAEIKLPEQEIEHVRPGQRVELKARAMPFVTYVGVVDRAAPSAAIAAPGEVQSSVTIYCRFSEDGHDGLASGMSGQARILNGPQPIGRIWGEKLLRLVRTEFWW